MSQYADVILPLPLQGAFTYALPDEFATRTQVGCRVIVPFGVRKFYTAIVVRLHDEKPPYLTKDVSELLDDAPAVLPSQLRLWKWVNEYYLCSLGEVFKAALPSGLKLESESVVLLNADWDATLPLTSGEEKVWQALQPKKKGNIRAVAGKLAESHRLEGDSSCREESFGERSRADEGGVAT